MALIAPPSSSASRVRRGVDPVALLVSAAGGSLGPSLARTRVVRDQVGLGRVERSSNLDGAFRARRPLSTSSPIVLVDDVVTSGATLLELRRAVRAAGGTVLGAAALAGTPLRSEAVPAAPPGTPGADPGAGVYGGGTA
ncbi:DNA utilization protein GntX [Rathayibacter tanaceti]|uniref:DNA utilization protein GntX n=1 Tax=Rathayibacter tanaceti TaxID=1671680 RepID=A0A162GFC4_9MICO|nr:DNA utilization protein GntX [Rathayibacter tanaceti]